MNPVLFPAKDILSQMILIQILYPELLHRAYIVPILFTKRLVACHRLICVTDSI